MIIFKSAFQLSRYLNQLKSQSKKCGFVPTMGALHEGHLSLVGLSNSNNDITVCSIFVNPTQFNNKEDFSKYPITIEKDIQLLIQKDCDVLFLPTSKEVYSNSYQIQHYELGDLEQLLEGSFRPGHFQGVCQVVDRLLQIVEPDNLYLGQKDFQQCMVLKKLVELKGLSQIISLHFAPTMREESGLAMSSRNLRLTLEQKEKAKLIYERMSTIKQQYLTKPLIEIEKETTDYLNSNGFIVDYVAICNINTLKPPLAKTDKLIVLIAASIGSIRLIDNMLLN